MTPTATAIQTSPLRRVDAGLELGPWSKAFPAMHAGIELDRVAALGLNVARGDLLLPALALRRDALEHDVELMASWCHCQGVSIAPHAKTTMAPYVLDLQLRAGAWGLTVATVAQAQVLHAFGVQRILLGLVRFRDRWARRLGGAAADDVHSAYALGSSITGCQPLMLYVLDHLLPYFAASPRGVVRFPDDVVRALTTPSPMLLRFSARRRRACGRLPPPCHRRARRPRMARAGGPLGGGARTDGESRRALPRPRYARAAPERRAARGARA